MLRSSTKTSREESKIKSYQNLVIKYSKERKILKANMIRAYAVLRYEFSAAFMIALTLPAGYKQPFNSFSLNPLALTKAQSQKRPTLLLHGACHNQAVWLYVAKTLQNMDLGPTFTVNIPFKITSIKSSVKNSFKVIDEKIAQIQQLYSKWNAEPVPINIVGYSAGAVFAYYLSLDKKCWSFDNTSSLPLLSYPLISNSTIHTVIFIGNHLHPLMPNMYEIVGEEDILAPPYFDEALQNEGKQTVIKCGHLNLLRSTMTSHNIFRILSPNQNLTASIAPTKENKNEDPVGFIQQKKYSCLHRLFKCRKNKVAYSHSSESKPNQKPMLSCTIL